LYLVKSVTMTGAGMKKTSIKASPGSRIFTIASDFIFVSVEGMTLKDGALATDFGGALSSLGPAGITLNDVLVDNCSAPYGGGLFVSGPLTVTSSVFRGCKATKAAPTGIGHGGAIFISISVDGESPAL